MATATKLLHDCQSEKRLDLCLFRKSDGFQLAPFSFIVAAEFVGMLLLLHFVALLLPSRESSSNEGLSNLVARDAILSHITRVSFRISTE